MARVKYVVKNEAKPYKAEANEVIKAEANELITFKSGAKSSKQNLRYDLIPSVAINKLAARYAKGAETYGDFNYKDGLSDKAFVIDRINHLYKHIIAFISPGNFTEFTDDNLGAILWGAAFLSEVEAMFPDIIIEIRYERKGAYENASGVR